jgi:hypothetical protein
MHHPLLPLVICTHDADFKLIRSRSKALRLLKAESMKTWEGNSWYESSLNKKGFLNIL